MKILNKLNFNKYGKYKIYYKTNKKFLNDIFEKIKKNVNIKIKNKSEVEFILNKSTTYEILDYEVKEITNVYNVIPYKINISELLKIQDENLQMVINILKNILQQVLEEYKNIVINKAIRLKEIKDKINLEAEEINQILKG